MIMWNAGAMRPKIFDKIFQYVSAGSELTAMENPVRSIYCSGESHYMKSQYEISDVVQRPCSDFRHSTPFIIILIL